MKKKILIGSHVSFKASEYLLGSVKESLSYGSNCMMIYTGPPQNTFRKEIDLNNVKSAHAMLNENNIDLNHCIVHAPYIINLASPKNEVYELAINFLKKEIARVAQIGFKYLVLHPGSGLTLSKENGLQKIIDGFNQVFKNDDSDVVVLIETMSGKGSELGVTISEIKTIINSVDKKNKLGVCLDTCHLWDSGQNINNPDEFLDKFEEHLDISLIKAVHLNDSKNVFGSKKDRHENIGYGKIGYDILVKWVYCSRLSNVPKILETPYFDKNNKFLPPYKEEIKILQNQKWFDFKK